MEPISNNQDGEAWISPELIELDVEQTALFPGVGTDGGPFADCTRS
jgi:hypothetical protein